MWLAMMPMKITELFYNGRESLIEPTLILIQRKFAETSKSKKNRSYRQQQIVGDKKKMSDSDKSC
jgi:hypothetical protein